MCSTRLEDRPSELERDFARPLVSEPTIDNVPVSVLRRVECSVRLEDEPSEPVKALGKPLLSDPEIESEPLRDLARPLVSETEIESEPDKDFAKPLASEALRPSEAVKALPNPLVLEPATEREPDIDLKNEDFSAPLRDRLRDPDRLAEHERGLELQINFPESTLATMLPMVNVIEAASVLKKEFFSTRLEARVSEALNDLSNDSF
jgi:hypothetical protein